MASETEAGRENLAFVIGRLEGYAEGLELQGGDDGLADALRNEAGVLQGILDGRGDHATVFPRPASQPSTVEEEKRYGPERWMVDYEHAEGEPQHAVLSWLSTDPTTRLPDAGTELVKLEEYERVKAAAIRHAEEWDDERAESNRLRQERDRAESASQPDPDLRERLEQRVLRTPEPTPKQAALMEQFEDEMPEWAQLALAQSEVERMRDEVRAAIANTPGTSAPTKEEEK